MGRSAFPPLPLFSPVSRFLSPPRHIWSTAWCVFFFSLALHYSAWEMFEISECIMGRCAGSPSCGVEAAAPPQAALLQPSKGAAFSNTASFFYE